MIPNPEDLIKLANMKMPFGKYQGTALIDLPEPYVVWFHGKGFPDGELGRLLGQLYEIKVNGLEHLIVPLKDSQAPAAHIFVQPEQLSEDALAGVIENFILREGTDYGLNEVSYETKAQQVRKQITRGEVKIVFDQMTETVSLLKTF